MQKLGLCVAAGFLGLATGVAAMSGFDFGLFRDHQLRADARQLFGVTGPLNASSTTSVDAATAEAGPTALVTLAHGLRVRVVTAAANAGPNIDMMVLSPDDVHATHLIVCNEQGPGQPGVQRIRLSNGVVETILTGTNSCDPVRRTAWGTIIVGEESGNSGWLLEIIDPLNTTGVLFDRGTGVASGPDAGNVVTRPAVGRLSWEGIALYPNGVMYYGDANRPYNWLALIVSRSGPVPGKVLECGHSLSSCEGEMKGLVLSHKTVMQIGDVIGTGEDVVEAEPERPEGPCPPGMAGA